MKPLYFAFSYNTSTDVVNPPQLLGYGNSKTKARAAVDALPTPCLSAWVARIGSDPANLVYRRADPVPPEYGSGPVYAGPRAYYAFALSRVQLADPDLFIDAIANPVMYVGTEVDEAKARALGITNTSDPIASRGWAAVLRWPCQEEPRL